MAVVSLPLALDCILVLVTLQAWTSALRCCLDGFADLRDGTDVELSWPLGQRESTMTTAASYV